MKVTKSKTYIAILYTALFSTALYAQPELSGKVTHESASFTKDGTSTGNTVSHASDAFKSETNARLFIDGEIDQIADGATYHVELQAYNDSDAISGYKNNESYTQRDALREAYIDTEYKDWLIRLGKQQVVWGTADGAKFLDIINPTDCSEMAQNQMEDSRIPVWMMNSERNLDDGGQLQVILSQPRENFFAGLNRNISTAYRTNNSFGSGAAAFAYGQLGSDTVSPGHDKGQAFILKGVDTISGQKNGFLNIVPDIGTIASIFGRAFEKDTTGAAGTSIAGMSNRNHDNYAMSYFTVGSFNQSGTYLNQFSSSYQANFDTSNNEGFDDMYFGQSGFWKTDANGCYRAASSGTSGVDGNGDACTYVPGTEGQYYSGQAALSGFAGMFGTSAQLQNTDSSINSVFELMDRTPFATFDAFANAKSQYVLDMPEDTDLNLALKYKNTTPEWDNFSFNYAYAYDANPVINLGFYDSAGNKLTVKRYDQTGSSSSQTEGTYVANIGDDYYTTSVLGLTGGSASGGYGGYALTNNASTAEAATLRFTQTLKRAHNIGGSFDTTIETEKYGPVVIRAEGIYQRGGYQPVIDRGALSIGDLPAALTMRKADRFKYVIGADITALTNMMVSLQFIQDINLDHFDENVDFDGTTCSAGRVITGNEANCGVYSLDFASMHLSNGLKKAQKAKEFVSVYLSKPFGESGQHRWNNITMLEDDGGLWNRFDVEYTIDDNTIATAEFNKYGGDSNTQFGQLEESSNIQLGVKYSF